MIYYKTLSTFIYILLTTLVILIASISQASYYGNFHNVFFVKNYDGDTLTVNLPKTTPLIGYHIPVRIRGVDTPETRGHCQQEVLLGLIAKSFVYNKLNNATTIDLLNVSRGKYFRIIADVYVDGKNLADLLLAEGYGKPYYGRGAKYDWCNQ